MKCIHCDTDNTYKDRLHGSGPRCKKCLHPFAFEPKTSADGMTDTLFQRSIKLVSADGTLAFTERQLWYELNSHLISKKRSCGASVLLLILGTAVAYKFCHGSLMVPAISTLMMAAATTTAKKPGATRYPVMTYDSFERTYLPRWIAIHGAIPKMLPPTSSGNAQSSFGDSGGGGSTDTTTVDAEGFSFDRALIIDHAEIADMLVANNFHFENNCAILSLDGYPFGKAETVMTMLARNPDLIVFALHDATIEGSQMGSALRKPDWFPDTSLRVIDLGLRPQHAVSGSLIGRQSGPVHFPVGLTSTSLKADEITWLEAGNTVELHALRPKSLMRAVFQGFSRAAQADAAAVGDDGIIIVDTGAPIWFYDAGLDVYAADSFG